MTRYHTEQAVVLAVGFLLGVGLEIWIAPGNILLWLLAGLAISLICREHFVREWGGELFGWFSHPYAPPRTPVVPRP